VFDQVYPILSRIIHARVHDEELASVAIVLAWYFWRRDAGRNQPRHYAYFAIRHAMAGRDLPGIKTYTDVFDRLTCWGGAGMGEVQDRKPGPDALVCHAEQIERWEARLNDTQRAVVALRLEGLSNQEVARQVGLTPGRTSQIAREVVEAYFSQE
jgi:hypothetical protein